MIMKHQILLDIESSTNKQTCVVNLKVSAQTCIVTNLSEINEEESQVKYDTLDDLTYSIPADLSFSCNELDQSPSRCKERFHEQLLTLIEPDIRVYLVDKIVDYMANFCRVEGNSDCGYIFDATLEILCFSMSGVGIGRYGAENGEEVIMCSVCLENLTVGMEFSALPCYHKFHRSCIDPWLERYSTCPNCRYCLDDVNAVEDRVMDLLRLNRYIRRNPSC